MHVPRSFTLSEEDLPVPDPDEFIIQLVRHAPGRGMKPFSFWREVLSYVDGIPLIASDTKMASVELIFRAVTVVLDYRRQKIVTQTPATKFHYDRPRSRTFVVKFGNSRAVLNIRIGHWAADNSTQLLNGVL